MSEPMNPDSERIYDAEIAPLMTRIIAVCKAHRIPMLATFQLSDGTTELDEENGGPMSCTTRIPFTGEDSQLIEAARVLLHRPRAFAFTVISGSTPPSTEGGR